MTVGGDPEYLLDGIMEGRLTYAGEVPEEEESEAITALIAAKRPPAPPT